MLHIDYYLTLLLYHMNKHQTRYRNFVAIGYPESLQSNWLDILTDSHIQVCISPLHNMDTDENGELKKEHYHILVMFDGVKTLEQAQELFNSIGATQCQVVNSIRGQARYLCHLDNTDKYPYDTSCVLCLNGADYFGLIDLPTNKYLAIREMIEFIEFNNILSFSDFIQYCSCQNENWFRSLCDNSSFIIKEFIKARTWTSDKDVQSRYDFKPIESYQLPSQEGDKNE